MLNGKQLKRQNNNTKWEENYKVIRTKMGEKKWGGQKMTENDRRIKKKKLIRNKNMKWQENGREKSENMILDRTKS